MRSYSYRLVSVEFHNIPDSERRINELASEGYRIIEVVHDQGGHRSVVYLEKTLPEDDPETTELDEILGQMKDAGLIEEVPTDTTRYDYGEVPDV